MTRASLIGLVAAAAVTAVAVVAHGQGGTREHTLPGARVFPEGVAALPGGSDFYVSSTTDGAIFRGSLARGAARVFLPGGRHGRTTATGLELDRKGHLFVSGAATAHMWVYDTRGRLLRHFDSSTGQSSFINDVAVAPNGDAYFTDSMRPFLYRVRARQAARRAPRVSRLRPWLRFDGTALRYQSGFNANGIAATPDGRHLIVVQSNTGRLFRIDRRTKRVTLIRGTGSQTNGDGLLLRGRVLYVARNALGRIQRVRLSRSRGRGTPAGTVTDPTLAYPTTLARARNRLLVVNSQFDKRQATPELPFTISSLPLP